MSINIILIIVIVGISLWALNDQSIMSRLILNPYIIDKRKEYYRLLTSGFIHANFLHLFLNMYALYLFGGLVEQYFAVFFGQNGNIYYLALFILGVIFANIPDMISKKNMSFYNSLGASGGVSSVVFASVILSPLSKLMIFPIPIAMPAYIFALVYVAYSIYMNKRQADNVNHMAHMWGGIWGVIFMLVVQPSAISSFFSQILGSFQ